MCVRLALLQPLPPLRHYNRAEEGRTRMSDSSNSNSSEVEQLRAQLDELRATDPAPILADAKQRAAAAVSSAAATVSDKVATVTDTVATQTHRAADQVRGVVASARRTAAEVDAQRESLSEQVRMRPFAALGIASVVGYVVGRIVR
jgi:ElaB/YqjD/DUF883 family membrane-anchored ribosome-binding protein